MLKRILSRELFPYILSLTAILALCIVGGLLWFEFQERFPSVAAGEYIGELHSMDPVRLGSVRYFYLRRDSATDQILVVMLEEGGRPQSIKAVMASSDSSNSNLISPLILSSASGTFRLTGELSSPGIYQGKVSEQQSGRNGSWVLRQQPQTPLTGSQLDQDQKLKLALRAELMKVEKDIQDASKLAPAQKEEIEKLTDFVTEGVVLKKRADQKLTLFKDQITEVGAKLKARYQAARNIEAKIELSQRVTAMGKLVSLARDTLEREARWVDSVLKGGPDIDYNDDLEREYERGRKIMEIKRAIALEEERAADSSQVTVIVKMEPMIMGGCKDEGGHKYILAYGRLRYDLGGVNTESYG